MKRLLTLAVAVCAVSLMTGCLRAPVVPPFGMIYTDYKAPLDYTQEGADLGTRRGEAKTESFVGLVAIGDASIATAARNGGISNPTAADYEYFNVLGVYQRYTTIVYGD